MNAPLRFLAIVVVGWVGLRAASLGMVPAAEVFAVERTASQSPGPVAAAPVAAPMPAAELPPAPGYNPAYASAAYPYPPYPYGFYPYGYLPAAGAQPPYAPPPPYPVRPAAIPIYYYVPMPQPAATRQPRPAAAYEAPQLPPAADFYAPLPDLDRWDLAEASLPPWPVWSGSSGSLPPASVAAVPPKLDRLQLSSWALLRNRPGPQSLASGGMLGGSQAGARMLYAFDPRLALSARVITPVGSGASGGEVAGGIRVTPLPAIPIALTAERRQRIGRYGGGRSDFALLVEGGLYQRPVGWGFALDGYAQAGVVGLESRDLFADGAFSLTRPIYGPLSAGFGLWGGAQPDLYRIDAGPRASLRLRGNMRLHFDWRQRLYGNAEPGSGPAVTIAADF